MDYRIEVFPKGQWSGRGTDIRAQIAQLGIEAVRDVRVHALYFVRGTLAQDQLDRLSAELLADSVVEGYRWQPVGALRLFGEPDPVIEVGFRPGVTDPVAGHLMRRAQLLGIGPIQAVTTGTRYILKGKLSVDELHRVARQVLYNDVIQTYTIGALTPEFVPPAEPTDAVDVVPLRDADDEQLARISRERVLFMSLAEMRTIRDEFARLGRDPTDVELETLAQTWSEHCLHKTFKGRIHYVCRGGMKRVLPEGVEKHAPYEEDIDGLLNSYIRRATDQLALPWVLSAFVDNAGIVEYDGVHEVSFKVETHNHPSALEPFGGANTGTGGVIRDVMGVSARPVAATDVLCFGPLGMSEREVPQGTLHPRRVARGVVAGIEDYGNKMGIPTVSGAILYHRDYVANPLVYCGCVGIAPKGLHRNEPQPGDLCVALGGRTGRDGLHGATFSSAELTHDTGQTVGSVVQIGDPITEKATLEAVIAARDEHLYTAITDCGAGGFSSAVGEMGSTVGVEVDLSNVPLKYHGLRPWEIWLSEAQERMVLAVPTQNLARLAEICRGYDVEHTVIGRFTGDGRLIVKYGAKTVADMDMNFMHKCWPRLTLSAIWTPPELSDPDTRAPREFTSTVLRMLAHPDVASKEDVIRRYDHEVQGGTLVKPLTGIANDGPSDAAVIRPLSTAGWQGLALGAGINPYYGQVDPYAMAWAVVDEAVRNVVAVGADPDRIALLDNFCWGNPALPDRLGSLVRATQGCHDAALAYGAPFISGKDSLNNEFVDASGQKRTIPPTLLISSLGLVPDVRQTITIELKHPGNWLYMIGETRNEMGGSLYYRMHGGLGAGVPAPVPRAIEAMRLVHRAIREGWILACHDCSEGGLGVAAAEMCIAGRMGLQLDLLDLPRSSDVRTNAVALFSESSGRLLVEVAPDHAATFVDLMQAGHVSHARIGWVTGSEMLSIRGMRGRTIVTAEVDALREAWQSAEIV